MLVGIICSRLGFHTCFCAYQAAKRPLLQSRSQPLANVGATKGTFDFVDSSSDGLCGVRGEQQDTV